MPSSVRKRGARFPSSSSFPSQQKLFPSSSGQSLSTKPSRNSFLPLVLLLLAWKCLFIVGASCLVLLMLSMTGRNALQEQLRNGTNQVCPKQKKNNVENKETNHLSSHEEMRTLNTSEMKYILYFNDYWGHSDFSFGMGRQPFIDAGCEETRCVATNHRRFFLHHEIKRNVDNDDDDDEGAPNDDDAVLRQQSMSQFDAVLFHFFFSTVDRPTRVSMGCDEDDDDHTWRKPHQRFVYVNMESPFYHVADPSAVYHSWKGFYNWTMTYRLDSQLPRPYGWFTLKDRNATEPILHGLWPVKYNATKWYEEYRQQKAGNRIEYMHQANKIGWIVSNCNSAPSNRMEVAEELQRVLKEQQQQENDEGIVEWDQYGPCEGSKKTCGGFKGDDCMEAIGGNKFYFSAENALAKDYLTEKVFLRMEQGFLPIVYGDSIHSYRDRLPPHSYLNLMEYESMEEAVKHIRQLAVNKTEYASYFWWKQYYTVMANVQASMNHTFCELCAKLHEDRTSSDGQSSPSPFDGDLFDWWIRGSQRTNPLEEWFPDWQWKHLGMKDKY